MPWRILYHEEVLSDLADIPANLQKRLRRAIEQRLQTAPEQYGERLSKNLSGLWKLRVGDYRVVFDLAPKAATVTIWAIRHRKQIYPEAARRWMRR